MTKTDDPGSVPEAEAAQGSAGSDAGRDSPKRQGDKLRVAAGSGSGVPPVDGKAVADSPKRHGDALRHAVDEAAAKR